jgi:PPP family 3-phenylpropionic acid transporter
VAIFLQYHGLSNTQIGIVTGLGAAFTVFTSPYLAGLIGKIKNMTNEKMVIFTMIGTFILYGLMSLLKFPHAVMIILYIVLIQLIAADVPVLSQICMDYLQDGEYLDFGLARGLGSLSYASAAALMGFLVDWINPLAVGCVHVISGLLVILMIKLLPKVAHHAAKKQRAAISMFHFISLYKRYFVILLAFMLPLSMASTIGTYLINIVKSLGGTSSLFGIATFLSAGSELPIMAITHRLLKKYTARQLFMVAAIAYVIRNITIALAGNLVLLIIGLLFQGLSFGLFTAVVTIYANDFVRKDHGMMAQTLLAVMISGVGPTIGNFVCGRLQDTLGLKAMLVFTSICTLSGFTIYFCLFLFGKKEEVKYE